MTTKGPVYNGTIQKGGTPASDPNRSTGWLGALLPPIGEAFGNVLAKGTATEMAYWSDQYVQAVNDRGAYTTAEPTATDVYGGFTGNINVFGMSVPMWALYAAAAAAAYYFVVRK